jgi:hypothetical protein
MSSYYYLSSPGLSNFEIDNNAISVTFPSIDRNYTVVNLFSDGAIITGNGAMIAGQIVFSMKFKKFYYTGTTKTSTTTTWNTFRYNIMTYMALAKNQAIYFNIIDSNGVKLQQRVYPFTRGSENYGTISISDEVNFTLQMEKAYFYNTTSYSSTYTVTSTQQEPFSVLNSGCLPAAPLFTFTPSQGLSSFSVLLYYGNYGFTLSSTFLTGQAITFNCANAQTTVNGVIVTGIQSAGSIFLIPPGTVTMYVAGCPGTLTTAFNERYI